MAWDNDSYNDVPTRIAEFRAKHPDGTLQAEVIHWPEPDCMFLAVKGYAYRGADDARPGIGLAWEPWPGKTNFTRDSELQNAETSAWGRAIIAVGAADAKKGVASAEEIRNRTSSAVRQGTPGPEPAAEATTSPPVDATRSRGGHEEEAPGGDLTSGGGVSYGEGETPPPADLDVESAWVALTLACGGDPAKARREVAKANPGVSAAASQADKVTLEQLQKALAHVRQGVLA